MGAHIFLDLFLNLTGTILSVAGDMPINSEPSVMNLLILRISNVLMGVVCVWVSVCERLRWYYMCACGYCLRKWKRGSQQKPFL